LIVRLLSGAIGLVVLVGLLVAFDGWIVKVIVPLVLGVCVLEYAKMAFPADRWAASAWLASGLAALYLVTVILSPETHHFEWLMATLTLLVVGTLLFVLLRPGAEIEMGADKVGRYLLGFGWLGLLCFLPLLRDLESGLTWVFLVLVVSWCSDTGAYFAGRAFGRRKLYPRVSPKKTWEGFFGGLVACTLGVGVTQWLADPGLVWWDVLIIGVGLGSLGVLGDLSESLLKRSFKVKDSGNIMPGHGGLLDRIDSVLFVCPCLFAYLSLVKRVAEGSMAI